MMSTKCQYRPAISTGVILRREWPRGRHARSHETMPTPSTVQRVQAGHDEIKREEQLRVALLRRSRPDGTPVPERVFRSNFSFHSNAFTPRKTPPRISVSTRTNDRLALAELRRAHGHHHGEAADQQDGGIDGAEVTFRLSWPPRTRPDTRGDRPCRPRTCRRRT